MRGTSGLAILSLAAALLFTPAASAQDGVLWEGYKKQFISADGRVIDFRQDRMSHSEGQGFGMILAVEFGDRPLFEKLWRWTKDNLRVRRDALFAWGWGQRPTGAWEVIDYNTASDGDVLIAFALLRASGKWNDGAYRGEAMKILDDLRGKLAVSWQGKTYILPGYYGYTPAKGMVLNTSYFIFPAYRAFARSHDRDFWETVYRDAERLLQRATFGSYHLPADWVLLDRGEAAAVYSEKSVFYGDDAIRVYLYSSLEGKTRAAEGVKKILHFYGKNGYIPRQVDLVRDTVSKKKAPAGYLAVYAAAAKKLGMNALSRDLMEKAGRMVPGEKDDYYSNTLYLLATLEGF